MSLLLIKGTNYFFFQQIVVFKCNSKDRAYRQSTFSALFLWQIENTLNRAFFKSMENFFSSSKLSAWSKFRLIFSRVAKAKDETLYGSRNYEFWADMCKTEPWWSPFLHKKGSWQGYFEKTKSNDELITIKVRLTLENIYLGMRNHFIMPWIASFMHEL